MLEDPSLMPAECQLQMVGEKISGATFDGKCAMPLVDRDQRGYDYSPVLSGKITILEDSSLCTPRPIGLMPNGAYTSCEPMKVVQLGNRYEQLDQKGECEVANYQLEECEQSNVYMANAHVSAMECNNNDMENQPISQSHFLSSSDIKASGLDCQNELEEKSSDNLYSEDSEDIRYASCTSQANRVEQSFSYKAVGADNFDQGVTGGMQVEQLDQKGECEVANYHLEECEQAIVYTADAHGPLMECNNNGMENQPQSQSHFLSSSDNKASGLDCLNELEEKSSDNLYSDDSEDMRYVSCTSQASKVEQSFSYKAVGADNFDQGVTGGMQGDTRKIDSDSCAPLEGADNIDKAFAGTVQGDTSTTNLDSPAPPKGAESFDQGVTGSVQDDTSKINLDCSAPFEGADNFDQCVTGAVLSDSRLTKFDSSAPLEGSDNFDQDVTGAVQFDMRKAPLGSSAPSEFEDLSLLCHAISSEEGSLSGLDASEISQMQESKADTLTGEASPKIHNDDLKTSCENQNSESLQYGDSEMDHVKALWVKWRGKWQTGFRCPRTDCPMSTLKAKPTHDRKSYIVVFFPRSRSYQWVDLLLTCPIEDYPVPLVNGTHRKWRKLVKDLSIPRRFIIQKLAMTMLNFSNELHVEAIVEDARKASAWNELALEASRCGCYSDLGRMLIRLHNMLLPAYVDPVWLQNSYDLWAHQCRDAQNAETIELLNEEFMQSVLSKKIDELWNAPIQPVLAPEWKAWKQEVLKVLIASQPIGYVPNERKKNKNDAGLDLNTRRKRSKLEIHRPEETILTNVAYEPKLLTQEYKCDAVSVNINLQEPVLPPTSDLYSFGRYPGHFVANQGCSPDEKDDRGKLSSFLGNGACSKVGESQNTISSLHNGKVALDSFRNYKQCSAFIENKGRQCGRWASDGDIYCCVHQDVGNAFKPSTSEKLPVTREPSKHMKCEPNQRDIAPVPVTSEPNKLMKYPEHVMQGNDTSNCTAQSMPNGKFGELQNSNLSVQDMKFESEFLISSRQCAAFIESKGRKCGRWASDGDVYCCVHQNINNAFRAPKDEKTLHNESLMCSGMTNAGTNCKHRAQHGSAFCKKHRFQTNPDCGTSDAFPSSSSSMTPLKRANCSNTVAESFPGPFRIKDHGTAEMSRTLVAADTKGSHYLMKSPEMPKPLPLAGSSNLQVQLCIGYSFQGDVVECGEQATHHNLYCEKHIPRFLKRARDGKSRLISKDTIVNLLKGCSSRNEKVLLHQSCDLLYGFLKGNLSRQDPVPRSANMEHLLAEVSKYPVLGECLSKLVAAEKTKLISVWGFGNDSEQQSLSSNRYDPGTVDEAGKEISYLLGWKCKMCAMEFSDEHKLGLHWTDVHKREARWLFRGYACAICLESYTNRKVLESHIQEQHGTKYIQNAVLFRCMSCNSQYINPELLWQHVLSSHAREFSVSHCPQPIEATNTLASNNSIDHLKDLNTCKFTCRVCGMKFDLLADLGRHHQASHASVGSLDCVTSGSGKYQINHNRNFNHDYRKRLKPTGRLKKQTSFGMPKNIRVPDLILSSRTTETIQSEVASLGILLELQCSNVAQKLFSKMLKSKPHPSNLEIFSVARATCCRDGLRFALEGKYGKLPQNFYLKAAKLCSEMDVLVDWHRESFKCPKGCPSPASSFVLQPLQCLQDGLLETSSSTIDPSDDTNWEMEEYHYVINSNHFGWKAKSKRTVLCEDLSFGKERVPIACVVYDENNCTELPPSASNAAYGDSHWQPWEGFSYVTEQLLEMPSVDNETNLQMTCTCSDAQCSPENCEHVIAFDSTYADARDIYDTPLKGRFAYDAGRIILKGVKPVYECNSLCKCNSSCPNRVVQNGIKVKMEIFRTPKKGWAVRASEPVRHGTFICELIGEVLTGDEAIQRKEMYANEGCSYVFDVAAQLEKQKLQTEESLPPFVVDATKYGNISRFINHSCSPNLSVRLVQVGGSMNGLPCRVGLFASQDIPSRKELTLDYAWELLPGEGRPCLCGSYCCRGRIC